MSAMLPLPRVDRRVIRLAAPDDVDGWRRSVRHLLAAHISPEDVEWHARGLNQADLFGATEAEAVALEPGSKSTMRVERDLLKRLQTAMLHSDPGRFALGYRIMWRLRDQPRLAQMSADADILALDALVKSVRRDIHKMHAFVRFRKVGARVDDRGTTREIFVAWFEPEHHITRTVGPFFRDRFSGMNWTIVTPEARISWNGDMLSDGPGGARSDVPGDDAVEAEWKRYYSSIFNPARMKPKAMKSEMPVKYWKNLPEAELISPLLRDADARMRAMIDHSKEPSSMPSLGTVRPKLEHTPSTFPSLAALNVFAVAHDRPPSNGFSSTIVVGEGPSDARLMLVGEQPGDQEDLQGRPFVGPAGQLLTRAMDEAGLDRKSVYLTNAVKRFKFEMRGKRRIHGTPSQSDISHYRWWLMQEIALVKPQLVMPLGSSAILSLLGKREKLSTLAGQHMRLDDGPDMIAAYHPSYILRLPDEEGREIEYKKLVRHLIMAREAVAA